MGNSRVYDYIPYLWGYPWEMSYIWENTVFLGKYLHSVTYSKDSKIFVNFKIISIENNNLKLRMFCI